MDLGKNSRTRLVLLCLAVVLMVWAVGLGFDRLLGDEGATRSQILIITNGLTGLVAGFLFYSLSNYERERHKLVEERLHTIAEMNHHIRNALQVITYAAASEDTQSMMLIRDSVDRIEWALREVLPGHSAAGAEPRPTNSAQDAWTARRTPGASTGP